MPEQRPDGLQVHRSRSCSDGPERDGAVGTASYESTRVCETRMGELADMKMLEMAKELWKVSEITYLDPFPRLYLATISRIEPNTSVEEAPLHVVVKVWWHIQPKSSSAQKTVLLHGQSCNSFSAVYSCEVC